MLGSSHAPVVAEGRLSVDYRPSSGVIGLGGETALLNGRKRHMLPVSTSRLMGGFEQLRTSRKT